jgi:hypothetical protein
MTERRPQPAGVGSFVRNPDGAQFTTDGIKLFDAAVTWATAR